MVAENVVHGLPRARVRSMLHSVSTRHLLFQTEKQKDGRANVSCYGVGYQNVGMRVTCMEIRLRLRSFVHK